MKRQHIEEDGRLTRADFTEERIAQLVRESDIPEGFVILDPETREASRRALLERHPTGADLWVFAYGSLMWNPAIRQAERCSGLVHGWHRQFCLWMPAGRGSVDNPGLMLGLDRGGACRGIAWRIRAAHVENETRILWRREMIGDGYRPCWVRARTPAGPVPAITFTVNRGHERYVADLSETRTVQALATAHGRLGRARDYLHNTVVHLDALGIADGPMHRLLALVEAYEGDGKGDSGSSGIA